jgi:hypothetical protein
MALPTGRRSADDELDRKEPTRDQSFLRRGADAKAHIGPVVHPVAGQIAAQRRPPSPPSEPIGYIPPAEAEANYYRQLAEQAVALA